MEVDQNYTHKYAGHAVVLRRFRRSWASILAQKMGYRTVFCYYLLKYWTKFNGSGRILLALNSSCSVWLVSQIGLIKKLLMFKVEIGRIFGLFGMTQISVQQSTRFTLQMLVFQNPQLVGSIPIYIFYSILRNWDSQIWLWSQVTALFWTFVRVPTFCYNFF